jgi:hypothetical protein
VSTAPGEATITGNASAAIRSTLMVRCSERKWRLAYPDHWKQYREQHPEAVERNRPRHRRRNQKRRLLNLAKNNFTLDIKR